MAQSSYKRRIDPVCYTTLRRATKRVRYGNGSLLPEDLLYIYGEDIMKRGRCDELIFKPNENYMTTVQKGSSEEIEDRASAVNFIIYAAARLHLYTDTLHLAVRNLDRLLSLQPYTGDNLELLGLGLLFDAAKHLESLEQTPWSVEIANKLEPLIDVTDQEIIDAETEALIALNFDMVVPTTITFVRSVIERADPIEGVQFEQLQCLTEFLGELTLLEYKFLRYYPSLIAASIIYYAVLVLNPDEKDIWKPNLQQLTGYSLHNIRECVKDVYELHSNKKLRTQYDCADQIYSRLNLMVVSKLKPVALPPYFEDQEIRRHTL